jgi:hypothetical protein
LGCEKIPSSSLGTPTHQADDNKGLHPGGRHGERNHPESSPYIISQAKRTSGFTPFQQKLTKLSTGQENDKM